MVRQNSEQKGRKRETHYDLSEKLIKGLRQYFKSRRKQVGLASRFRKNVIDF